MMQIGLARDPATAYFLTAPEKEWLAERQANDIALRTAESSTAGNMWGESCCAMHAHPSGFCRRLMSLVVAQSQAGVAGCLDLHS